ncbi:MAG TPA: DUF4286 family protein [Steroidobacteraceae bacterium]|nr:DUF4286 family protein [Steroidobacteraceae bacterium]
MPSNLIYEVECELDPDIVGDYDAWLPGHVQDVLACAGFLGAAIEAPETPPGARQRRIIRYELESAAALDHYLENEATRLRTETAQRFGGRVRCERRALRPRHDLVPASRAPVTCLDCGAPVPGAHCARCGQAADVHVLSMKEVAGDVTHSLLHLDSRVWRTLRLLLRRPGELTREFVAGRHQRYLPPFRLYLAISILFFALNALLPGTDIVKLNDSGRESRASIAVMAPEELRRELAAEGILPADDGQAGSDTRRCQVEFSDNPAFDDIERSLTNACRKILADDGKRFAQQFATTAPKLMFLFLPLMAAVALLFYRRPRRLYAEHLVLFLHNHSFTFILLAVTDVIDALAGLKPPYTTLIGTANLPLYLFLPYYVFRSMRVVYGEGRLRTSLKFAAIAVIYLVLLGLTMLAGLVYSMLQLA